VLRLIGEGGALAAVAAVGGGTIRAVDQGVFATGEGPAYAAWNDWQGVAGDGPLNLVRAAVVAANAHNAQPWLFRIDVNGVDLFADTSRGTGANGRTARAGGQADAGHPTGARGHPARAGRRAHVR